MRKSPSKKPNRSAKTSNVAAEPKPVEVLNEQPVQFEEMNPPPTVHQGEKTINLAQPHIQVAISRGQDLIREGRSKADAARVIYDLIKDEEKDLVVAAFVAGATLTAKGAMTYWYNCRRKSAKDSKPNR